MKALAWLLFWLPTLTWGQDLDLGLGLYQKAQTLEGRPRQEALAQAERVFASLAPQAGQARLWADLGRIREDLGQPAPALWAYRQALWLDPNLPQAQEGLERLLQALGVEEPPPNPLLRLLGLPSWLWGFGLWAGLLGFGWLWRERRAGAMVCLSLGLALGGMLLAPTLWAKLPRPAQALEATGLREGPGLEFPVAQPLPPGQLVEPEETRGPWVRLELGGRSLWVERSALGGLEGR